ncbi:MAG: amidase family protein [Vicinamibacterales bacterium]
MNSTRISEQRSKKKTLGKLHGLPVVVKDVFATEGVRTTSGSKALESYTPKEDAAAVARLKAAGAIIVGKTNVPEFAGDWQSYNQ